MSLWTVLIVVLTGKLEGDLRAIKWTGRSKASQEVLWIDTEQVCAVVVK